MVTDLEPPQTGFTISMFLIEKKATGNFVSTTKALTKKSRIAKLTLTGVSASCNPRHISWDIYSFLHLSQLAIINIELGRRVKKKKLIDVIREKYPNLLHREWRSLPWLSDRTECVSMKCSYEAISVREPTHIRNYLRKL